MKYIFGFILSFFTMSSFAQSQFQVIQEGNDRILMGILSRNDITNDSTFRWYKQNQAGYTPNASAVNAFRQKGSQVQVIAFGGTWCEDTRYILPKFYSIVDAAGFSDDRITLVGVDRRKKTISHLAEALNVINVPTFIVLKDGIEVGRVVEYGKTGAWDKELGDLLNNIK